MSGRRVFLSGALLAGFAVVAGWVAVRGSFPGDSAAVVTLDEWLGDSVDRPMVLVRRLTDTAALAVVAGIVMVALLIRRRWPDAVFLGVGVALVWAVNPVLKEIFDRPRPGVATSLETVSAYGFPSGHAAGTAALVGALLTVLGSRRAWLVAFGVVVLAVVAFAQLAIGVHYPSDILAGWFWAGAWIVAVSSVRDRIRAWGE